MKPGATMSPETSIDSAPSGTVSRDPTSTIYPSPMATSATTGSEPSPG